MQKLTGATALLALALFTGCGKEGSVPSAILGGDATISSISQITGAENRKALVGRRVDLKAVRTTSVVGDVTFWVGEDNKTALVVKGSELRDQADEGRVQAGRNYHITGVVRLVENVPRNDTTWDLVDDSEFDAIKDAQVYIESDSITVVE